jgi:hypothetical protein
VLLALERHEYAFKAICDLNCGRGALQTAGLLKVGELGDFKTVEPNFPAEAPGAENRALPIVLNEADVMKGGIDAEGFEGLEVKLLRGVGLGLKHDLKLGVALGAVGVVTKAAIGGADGSLEVACPPRLGAEHAEEGSRVHGPGAHFHVV